MKKLIILAAALLAFTVCGGSNIPDRIEIISEDGSVTTAQKHGRTFTTGDVTVRFTKKDGGMAATLKAPGTKVKYVKAWWKGGTSRNALYLGDHWERTYGDLGWRRLDSTRTMPWYFISAEQPERLLGGAVAARGRMNGRDERSEAPQGRCTGCGVMTGCNSFCSWNVDEQGISLTMDVRSGSHGIDLGTRTLEMATILFFKGRKGESAFDALHRFCKLMCPNPRLPEKPVYGVNDWYFAYGRNSEELITKVSGIISELVPETDNKPYFVIDDGWAMYSFQDDPGFEGKGGFIESNAKFPDMKRMADKIRQAGFRPGLWMRPLSAWKGCDESLLMPAFNPSECDRYFDPTVPEVREYIRKCFETYHEWGYEMVKHDFSTVDIFQRWGNSMMDNGDITLGDWQFHDTTLTNAEVVLQFYRDIREAAGDICIIGCNTVSHLSAGLFELQRTGNDTSGRAWGPTVHNGVNTLTARSAQHNAFYSVDADCVGITTAVDWDHTKRWLDLCAGSGTALFISPQPEAIGEEQRAAIREAFTIAAQENPIGEPLDWMQTDWATRWKLLGKEVVFDWK